MSNTSLKERLRWKVWHLACKLPIVCPANAHSTVIYGVRRSPLIDQVCCNDANNNGACWCGKVQGPRRAPDPLLGRYVPEPTAATGGDTNV